MDNNQSFSYTYSAEQRQEVEAIRQKYLPKTEDKMEQLRRLHQIPTGRATTWALILGIPGALILGTGMSLCMTDLGASLGAMALVLGIVVGLTGLVMAALAYPVYNRVLRRERERLAPEILRLTEELLK